MSEINFNELPPDKVSTVQLLIMIREMRADAEDARHEMAKIGKNVEEMRKAFDTAGTVVNIVKWLAAFGAACAAAVGSLEVLKKFFPG